jgi:hypothetical protein
MTSGPGLRQLVVSTLLVVVLAGPALATRPHVREGWHVGVAYGAAVGNFEGPEGDALEFEDGVSPHIRASHMLGPRLGVGLSYAGWMYETGQLPTKFRYSIQSLVLAASWYPGPADQALGGLCLRGGLGLGWVGYAEVDIVEDQEQGHGDRTELSGLALELNLSYEFRLTDTVVAGLGLGVNSMGAADDRLRSATFVPLTVNLGWYWD